MKQVRILGMVTLFAALLTGNAIALWKAIGQKDKQAFVATGFVI